jgi:hypothetical protein
MVTVLDSMVAKGEGRHDERAAEHNPSTSPGRNMAVEDLDGIRGINRHPLEWRIPIVQSHRNRAHRVI